MNYKIFISIFNVKKRTVVVRFVRIYVQTDRRPMPMSAISTTMNNAGPWLIAILQI